MDIITRKGTGLFPAPTEIKLKCSCPDWATMCKHVAAVLYGVGARLDESPELLFVLRSVDKEELITQAASATDLAAKTGIGGPEISESDIGAVFGIEMDTQAQPAAPVAPAKAVKPTKAAKRAKVKAPAMATEKPGASAIASAASKPAVKIPAKSKKPAPAKAKKKAGNPF
jgi:uncharacterized Zn finger protein